MADRSELDRFDACLASLHGHDLAERQVRISIAQSALQDYRDDPTAENAHWLMTFIHGELDRFVEFDSQAVYERFVEEIEGTRSEIRAMVEHFPPEAE